MQVTHIEELAPTGMECPSCGEDRIDELVFNEEGDFITCSTCGKTYEVTFD